MKSKKILTKKPIYDNESFFNLYSQMVRSVSGLSGSGEWKTLQRLFPNPKNLHVLDLGCGFGWHCKYAAEKGALKIIGVDNSSAMITKAKKINKHSKIEYITSDITTLDFANNSFDMVLSSLVFHYLSDFQLKRLFKQIANWLTPNGTLLFSAEHPIFTAVGGKQDWIYDDQNKIKHFPVDNYFINGSRETFFLGHKIKKYHRNIETYFKLINDSGLAVVNIVEPTPSKALLASDPSMVNELRRPMMIIIKAQK